MGQNGQCKIKFQMVVMNSYLLMQNVTLRKQMLEVNRQSAAEL